VCDGDFGGWVSVEAWALSDQNADCVQGCTC
jgi:hypothetical protein